MDLIREMLGKNLTRAQKDLDDAHRPVKIFEMRLQESESRRDNVDQIYQSAQLRSRPSSDRLYPTRNCQKLCSKLSEGTGFRCDFNALTQELHLSWIQIEEELTNGTSIDGAYSCSRNGTNQGLAGVGSRWCLAADARREGQGS